MPGAAPMPLQVSHVSCRGIWIVVSTPLADFVERDLEVVAQVGAALRTAAAAAAAEDIAEAEDVAEAAEDVLEAGEDGRIESAGRRAAERRRGRSGRTVPLVGVGEDGVRLGRFLELLFGRLVAGIAIGMVLAARACGTRS